MIRITRRILSPPWSSAPASVTKTLKSTECSSPSILPTTVVSSNDMRQFVDILRVSSRGRGLVEITQDVLDWLRPHGVQTGLLTLFCRHTSAGLLIQENAAPDVRADLETFFEQIGRASC